MTTKKTRSNMAQELGRRGGLKGGAARAKALDPGHRREIARAAAQARWQDEGKPQQLRHAVPKLRYDTEYGQAVLVFWNTVVMAHLKDKTATLEDVGRAALVRSLIEGHPYGDSTKQLCAHHLDDLAEVPALRDAARAMMKAMPGVRTIPRREDMDTKSMYDERDES